MTFHFKEKEYKVMRSIMICLCSKGNQEMIKLQKYQLNIERSYHDWLYQGIWARLCHVDLKIQKFNKECKSSLASLTCRNLIFLKAISPSTLHQKSYASYPALCFTSSLTAWSQFLFNMMPSLCKVINFAIKAKCKQRGQQKSPFFKTCFGV